MVWACIVLHYQSDSAVPEREDGLAEPTFIFIQVFEISILGYMNFLKDLADDFLYFSYCQQISHAEPNQQ